MHDHYDLTYGPFTSWVDADFAEILAWARRMDGEADWAGDWLTYSVAASDVDRHLGPASPWTKSGRRPKIAPKFRR